ncbi:hypothetical protein [Ottowia sp.]|uniref:AbiTii domain-containing protein n=1 Tax=Ottowia sp. TaxID=1898956 RepID=UPI0026167077|nr:hypothetical protein [Ottowia sp.]
MPALVPELVNMASDPTISTTDLLRRALVVARRLAVPELVDWISSEMNGYKHGTPLPDYRIVYGSLMAYNDVRGHDIPCSIEDHRTSELLRRHSEHQSIPVLEQLLASGVQLVKHFPASLESQLEDSMMIPMRPKLVFSNPQVQGIVEMVRNRILDWALDLEGRGIIGEGMSFTPQEKQAVQQQHYHFGNVSDSQIQIGSNGSTQTQANTTGNDIEALKGLVQALGATLANVKGDAADELRAELATLKAQADSPKPKWEIIKATARSIKTITEGAAGNILASLAQPHIATLMALAAA